MDELTVLGKYRPKRTFTISMMYNGYYMYNFHVIFLKLYDTLVEIGIMVI